jgi:hypothetical protein
MGRGRCGQPSTHAGRGGCVFFFVVQREGSTDEIVGLPLRARTFQNLRECKERLGMAIQGIGLHREFHRLARQGLCFGRFAQSGKELRLDRVPRQGCVEVVVTSGCARYAYPFGCFVVTPLLIERRRELRWVTARRSGSSSRVRRAQCALGGLGVGSADQPDRASSDNGRSSARRAVKVACMLA